MPDIRSPLRKTYVGPDMIEAAQVGVDSTGFDGNLATTDDNLQKVAQKLDDLTAGGGGEENVQSDWDVTDTSSDAYIKNKPGNATQTADGFQSAADKTKLDSLPPAATIPTLDDFYANETHVRYFFEGAANFATRTDRRGYLTITSTSATPSSANAVALPLTAGTTYWLWLSVIARNPSSPGFTDAQAATDWPNAQQTFMRDSNHDPAENFYELTSTSAATRTPASGSDNTATISFSFTPALHGSIAGETSQGILWFLSTRRDSTVPQPNWTEGDANSPAYIRNKPTIPATSLPYKGQYADNTAYDPNDVVRTGGVGTYDYWVVDAPITTANTSGPPGNTSFKPLSADVTVTGGNITLTRNGAGVNLTTDTLAPARSAGSSDHIGGRGGTAGQFWGYNTNDTDAGWRNPPAGGGGGSITLEDSGTSRGSHGTVNFRNGLTADVAGNVDVALVGAVHDHFAFYPDPNTFRVKDGLGNTGNGIKGMMQISSNTDGAIPTDAQIYNDFLAVYNAAGADADNKVQMSFQASTTPDKDEEGRFGPKLSSTDVTGLEYILAHAINGVFDKDKGVRVSDVTISATEKSGQVDEYYRGHFMAWKLGTITSSDHLTRTLKLYDDTPTDADVNISQGDVFGLAAREEQQEAAIQKRELLTTQTAQISGYGQREYMSMWREDVEGREVPGSRVNLRFATPDSMSAFVNPLLGIGTVNFYGEWSDLALNDSGWGNVEDPLDSRGFFTAFDSTTTLTDATIFTVASGSRPFRTVAACTLQMNVSLRADNPDVAGGPAYTVAFTAPDLPIGTEFVMTNLRDGQLLGELVWTTTAAPTFLMTGNRRYFNVQCSLTLHGDVESFNRGIGGFVVARFTNFRLPTELLHIAAKGIFGVLSQYNLPTPSATRRGALRLSTQQSIEERRGSVPSTSSNPELHLPTLLTTADFPLTEVTLKAMGIRRPLFAEDELGHFRAYPALSSSTLLSIWSKGNGSPPASGEVDFTAGGLLFNKVDRAGVDRETALHFNSAGTSDKRFRLGNVGDANSLVAIFNVHRTYDDSASNVPTDCVLWEYTMIQGTLASAADLPGGTGNCRFDEMTLYTDVNGVNGGIRLDTAGSGFVINADDLGARDISDTFTANKSIAIYNEDAPMGTLPNVYAYTAVTNPTSGRDDYTFASVTRTDRPPASEIILYERMRLEIFTPVAPGTVGQRVVSGREVSADPTLIAVLGRELATLAQLRNVENILLSVDANTDVSVASGLGAAQLVQGTNWIREDKDDATKSLGWDSGGYYPLAKFDTSTGGAVRRSTIFVNHEGVPPDGIIVAVMLRSAPNGGAGSNNRHGSGFYFIACDPPTTIASNQGEQDFRRGFVTFWEGFREAAHSSVSGHSGYTGSFQLAPKVTGTANTNQFCTWEANPALGYSSSNAAAGAVLAPTSGGDNYKLVVRAGTRTYTSGQYAQVSAAPTQGGRLVVFVNKVWAGTCTWPVSRWGTGTGENPTGIPYRTDYPLSRVGKIPSTIPNWENRASNNPYYINSIVLYPNGGTAYIMDGNLKTTADDPGTVIMSRSGSSNPSVDTSAWRLLDWASGTNYAINEIVRHAGKFWISDADPAAGDTPGVTTHWRELKEGEYLYKPGDHSGFAGHAWTGSNANPDVRLRELNAGRPGIF